MLTCFLLTAALTCPAPPDRDPMGPEITLLVTVRNLDALGDPDDANGSFLARRRGRSYHVEVGSATTYTRHRSVRLDRIPDGTHLHLLGRRQEPQRVPVPGGGSYTMPERIVQLQVVLGAPHYDPPTLSDVQKRDKLQWLQGPLTREKTENRLGTTTMEAGKDYPVLVLGEMAKHEIERGHKLFVTGRIDDPKQKTPTFRARTVARIAPRFPPKSYRLLYPPPVKDAQRRVRRGD